MMKGMIHLAHQVLHLKKTLFQHQKNQIFPKWNRTRELGKCFVVVAVGRHKSLGEGKRKIKNIY